MLNTTTDRKCLIIAAVLWLLLAAMLVAFHILSVQTGEASVRLSRAIAVRIASVLYRDDGAANIELVNIVIRKAAHFCIFFLLGFIGIITVRYTVAGFGLAISDGRICVALLAFNLFYSFFDEWQKQFVAGRHNTISEALINAVGGTIGILIGHFLIAKGFLKV